ncbi:hypothetical protein CFBP7900_16770 [Xanthomonas hortorum pv. carotae]|uniref:Uncharacterized protein n=1 Tax=Xanthomonas hortorum pv. carotae TaxID=487904 RepID=A0A6V7D277_9XANT|nr:hypothetical protein CFBP7900_16770 [Xanthomonas hortorum pv. carotae]CAD0326607.1 hypothetical protein CFBP7900_16770 [Xanthomonas hortorum pv. carotae]
MSAIDAGDEPVLPPGFRWDRPWRGAMGPVPPGEPFARFVQRDCSSFDQGRRGTVMWATRHEARIRAEVATRMPR